MRGSCLCATVQYEVLKFSAPIDHCSCRMCRKAHAAAFNTAAGVLRQDFRWTAGAQAVKAYESSPGKLRHFCSNCGSQLLSERTGQPMMFLRVATLDEDPGLRPEFRIWKSHEVPWLAYGDLIATYEEAQP
ncbi:GFA family protein [Ramlibacter sp.]|uniref:GFA family protein n=1 Tax=Ramlibacter sp. TaxID=1917967 RepID=UPI00182B8570|nr:GFA family protein [Ramlibacter sp.]MBA2672234.1 GFA family protein [Ramlibacter sp.]